MSRKILITGMVLLLLLVLVACSGSLLAYLDISVVDEISEHTDLVYLVDATIQIETLTDEEDGELTAKIGEWFRGAKNIHYEEAAFSNLLVADIKVPVVNFNNQTFDSSGDLITLLVEGDYLGITYLGFRFSESLVDEINDYLLANYFTQLSIKDWQFSINLYNDTAAERSLSLNGVFADEEPVIYPSSYSLSPQEGLKITIGDVLKEWGYRWGEGDFASFY